MFAVLPTPHRSVLSPQLLQTISPTQYAYTFPAFPSFTHLVIFLLPDQVLPPDSLAGIYLHLPSMQPGEFKLLGALGPVIDANGNINQGTEQNKVSAIFRVAGLSTGNDAAQASGDMEMDSGSTVPSTASGDVTVGISIEPLTTLGPQILALNANKSNSAVGNPSTAIMRSSVALPANSTANTKVLAQKIIQNAFNFLSSFTSGSGQDVVPLKAFEDWWKKFEKKIEADPGFLERDA